MFDGHESSPRTRRGSAPVPGQTSTIECAKLDDVRENQAKKAKKAKQGVMMTLLHSHEQARHRVRCTVFDSSYRQPDSDRTTFREGAQKLRMRGVQVASHAFSTALGFLRKGRARLLPLPWQARSAFRSDGL